MRRDIENWLESVYQSEASEIRKIGGEYGYSDYYKFYEKKNDYDICKNDIGNEKIIENKEDEKQVVENYGTIKVYLYRDTTSNIGILGVHEYKFEEFNNIVENDLSNEEKRINKNGEKFYYEFENENEYNNFLKEVKQNRINDTLIIKYDKKKIYVDRRKPRSHIHALFINLIKKIENENMTIKNGKNYNNILTAEDKKAFYNFCYLNRSQ